MAVSFGGWGSQGHDMGRHSPPVPSPMMLSQGTDMRPDGGCRDEARTVPGWETTLVVWGWGGSWL